MEEAAKVPHESATEIQIDTSTTKNAENETSPEKTFSRVPQSYKLSPKQNCLDNNSDKSKVSISKREQKRLLKKQKWEANKIHRRQKTRMKEKELKEKLKKGLIPYPEGLSRKQKKSNLMINSSCKVGVAIDMSFDHLMIDKDLSKCIKQIHRCYSINRRQDNPVQFHVTSFDGKAKETMKKHTGWENWDVNFSDKAYTALETFPKDRLVYLSSESDNVLTELKPDYLYVIGGLVDHNSQKGLCHKLAEENGVTHARLPITEHIVMKTRKVLTIDHVFEILVLVAQNTPWQDALMKVIAPRKLPQVKTTSDSSRDNSE